MQGSGVYYGSTYKSNGHTYIIQSELELHFQFELGRVLQDTSYVVPKKTSFTIVQRSKLKT